MKTKTVIKLSLAAALVTALVTVTARAEDATALWNKSCASCHGKDGKGQTKMGKKKGVKDYTDAKIDGTVMDYKASETIKDGVKDYKGEEKMKAYGNAVSVDDIKS